MPSAVDLAARLAAIVKTQEEILSVRLDPNAVRKLAVEAAQSLTGADGAVLETVREDGDIMYHTATGTLLPHVGTLFPLESSFSGLCIEKQQPLRTDDALEDPRVNRDISKATG